MRTAGPFLLQPHDCPSHHVRFPRLPCRQVSLIVPLTQGLWAAATRPLNRLANIMSHPAVRNLLDTTGILVLRSQTTGHCPVTDCTCSIQTWGVTEVHLPSRLGGDIPLGWASCCNLRRPHPLGQDQQVLAGADISIHPDAWRECSQCEEFKLSWRQIQLLSSAETVQG